MSKFSRVFKWDLALLRVLTEASGCNHNTIRNNVKHLAEALDIELPKIRE